MHLTHTVLNLIHFVLSPASLYKQNIISQIFPSTAFSACFHRCVKTYKFKRTRKLHASLRLNYSLIATKMYIPDTMITHTDN